MRYARMFMAILTKDLVYQWRYKVNTIVGIAFLIFICFGIIYGLDRFAGQGTNAAEKAGLIGGYILWVVMITNYQAISRTIRTESLLGTLEQVYLNVPSMFAYSLFKCVSIFLTSLIMLYSVTVIILLANGLPIDARLLHILPVILLGMPALWAVSMAVGSLGLVLKQIDAVTSVVSMIVIASIPILVQKSQLACLLLPFGLSNKLSQDIFTGDTALGGIGFTEVSMILANDLAYLVLGTVVYKISETYAKKYGKLAHH